MMGLGTFPFKKKKKGWGKRGNDKVKSYSPLRYHCYGVESPAQLSSALKLASSIEEPAKAATCCNDKITHHLTADNCPIEGDWRRT